MSDLSYKIARAMCYPMFWVSSSPVFVHTERANLPGAFILAPNHISPLDTPCVMAATGRPLDWMSIVEMQRKPLVGWFFRLFNTFFVDRGIADVRAVRTIVNRLKQGRVIAMFPEAFIRDKTNSVLTGGSIRPGVARLAHMANVPIVPCVVIGTKTYTTISSWLPLKRTRYAVIFGLPIRPRQDLPESESRSRLLDELKQSYVSLYQELLQELRQSGNPLAASGGLE
jgi:1-acyl-sn-glycerol-3-phosphate acyltransferase